ncbi:cell division protein ZapA [Lichenihabitans sp. Uapishka_5]|uniref:cell division protein ZapA n=1 Tax=Lichenihabitans sp. Uapishka_5 TaxID=3037302 RepID=UPI0029E7D043|nr:cell division protein ZapA [Lichenihabitans sp. Uapishka_5]MDX7949923.1 cell division protein ZapA [Lichenihabitans sp. Uapishka_5]
MTQVTVSIAGRSYRMACDDGEEAHLERLAERLDAKITELRGHFGEIGDGRITVMAALTIADDLSAAEARVAALEARLAAVADLEASVDDRLEAGYATVAEAVVEAAQRIERIARGLDAIGRD